MSESSDHLKLVLEGDNELPLECDGMGKSHHGCAAYKSAASV